MHRTLHDGHQIRRPDPVPRLGKNSPVLPLQWLDVAIQVTEILQEMHSLRIIHNDIKTNNLCLDITPEGVEVTVIDFALATEKGEYVIFFRRLEVLLLLPSRSLREGGRLKWSLRCLWLGARHVEDPAVRPPGDDGADGVVEEPELQHLVPRGSTRPPAVPEGGTEDPGAAHEATKSVFVAAHNLCSNR